MPHKPSRTAISNTIHHFPKIHTHNTLSRSPPTASFTESNLPFILLCARTPPKKKTGGVALKKCLQEQCCVMSASTYSPQSLLLQGRSKHKQTPNYTRVLSRGHMSAIDVHPSIPTFCILREPYIRVRSAFRFLKEGGQHSEFICAKGTINVLVDKVFVLETLRAHDIAQLLHIPSFRLEKRNKSRVPYTLSPKDKQHIQKKHYKHDFTVYNRYCRT